MICVPEVFFRDLFLLILSTIPNYRDRKIDRKVEERETLKILRDRHSYRLTCM